MKGAGIGQFDDGPLAAQWDGVLGGRPSGSEEGPLAAYKDGVLGRLRGMGQFGAPRAASAGLGRRRMRGVGEYFAQKGMGEYFAPRGMGEYFQPRGAAGLGEYFQPRGAAGLGGCMTCGMGEYFAPRGLRGMRGMRGMRGLGQAGGGPVDLRKLEILRELKTAMFAYYAGLPGAAPDQYGELWLTSGTWEPETTAMWFQIGSALASMSGSASETFITSLTTPDEQTAMIPTPMGVQALMNNVGQLYFSAPDSPPMDATYPTLAAMAVTGISSVTPPYFTSQQKMRASVQKFALLGVGAAAVVAIVVAARKKR